MHTVGRWSLSCSLSGAYYILDGQEREISKSIDIKKPLWAVIDIYGNVKGTDSGLFSCP